MGWMRALFLGDIGNHLDIIDNQRELEGVRRSLRSVSSRQQAVDASQTEQIEALRAEIEQLELAVASLARLLVANGCISQADVEALVKRLEP